MCCLQSATRWAVYTAASLLRQYKAEHQVGMHTVQGGPLLGPFVPTKVLEFEGE